ncbi:hypothetical protein [Burkholderia stagnalis]|uniref:hypothetical protein n=1 Tax=Burkholderia stagnalis TaxID=1503054 RepID=UPI000F8091FC|nr:hypothetical protein [Burkholderia stagnalis]
MLGLVKHARWIYAVTLMSGVFAGNAAHATSIDAGKCISQDDVKEIDKVFFSDFPNADAMKRYAGQQKFEIATNVADGITLQKEAASNDAKVDWLANFLRDRHDFFSDFSRFERPSYTYMRNGMSSVDNLRTTQKFPRSQCVQEVSYNMRAGACIRGQKLQSLSLTFVKDDRPLHFAGVELYFMACPAE